MKNGANARRKNWILARYVREARRNRYFDQLWNIDPLFKTLGPGDLRLEEA